METIAAIDLGKHKSVVCKMDRGSLKTQYRTVRTRSEVFGDLIAGLKQNDGVFVPALRSSLFEFLPSLFELWRDRSPRQARFELLVVRFRDCGGFLAIQMSLWRGFLT